MHGLSQFCQDQEKHTRKPYYRRRTQTQCSSEGGQSQFRKKISPNLPTQTGLLADSQLLMLVNTTSTNILDATFTKGTATTYVTCLPE